MRAWILILALVVFPAVLASQEAEDIFASESITVDLAVSSTLTLTPKNNKLDIEYLQADLYFFPKEDETQQVFGVISQPESDRFKDYLRFRWEPPTSNTFRYLAQGNVKITNVFPRVTGKIKFPLTGVAEEAQEYLKPTEHVDSNYPAIVNIANTLAQGHDDLFIVVSEIAIWTKNNIKYNLSSVTADASQKASWVLENKQGVCDELTSLFIAMCRSVGIPARFVTGVSYTASPLAPTRWGPHGWAEVYFPGVGWIPFDPTFGEFGWVDPGHIKMITGADPEIPGVRFEWQGMADLDYTPQKVDASIVSVSGRIQPVVRLSVNPVYKEVGFGSYNLAQATVENLQPHYVTTEVRLAKVAEMQPIEPLDRQVILKPFEKKTLFWRVQVDPALNGKFVYTMPLGVYTVMNDTAFSSFSAKSDASHHTRSDITRVMNTLSEDEGPEVQHTLEMDCTPDRTTIHPDEKAAITCTLRNIGTAPLKSMSVCIEQKQCSTLDIGIGQVRQLSFNQGFVPAGSTTVFVRAKNSELAKNVPLAFEMLDFPDLNITGFNYPASVKYGEKFTLLFLLKPESYNKPRNVELQVSTPAGRRNFEVAVLEDAVPFEVELDSGELSLGTTAIKVEAEYSDEKGKSYAADAEAPIMLTDVPFFPSIWLWVRGLFV